VRRRAFSASTKTAGRTPVAPLTTEQTFRRRVPPRVRRRCRRRSRTATGAGSPAKAPAPGVDAVASLSLVRRARAKHLASGSTTMAEAASPDARADRPPHVVRAVSRMGWPSRGAAEDLPQGDAALRIAGRRVGSSRRGSRGCAEPPGRPAGVGHAAGQRGHRGLGPAR